MTAICNAIAAKYAPGAITAPAGQNPMRRAFAQAPNNIPEFPCVVVLPDNGKVIAGAGTWDVVCRIDVNCYFGSAEGDFSIIESSRQAWLPVLLGALAANQGLGLSYVKSAMPATWDFRSEDYAGASYNIINIEFEVIVREPVTLAP
jgi:hypothetical protein